jgi:phosphoglycerol transferase MdoB-like AlkP superfamily enzyme
VLQGSQGRYLTCGGYRDVIVYYVVFMVIGDFAAYFLGLFSEYEWGSQVSLVVFLALYFAFLWVSWILAVHFTKPKSVEQQAT